MELKLTDEEREFLVDTLEARRQELHPEIRRCMDHNFKEALKRNLECCEKLLQRLTTKPANAD